MPHVTAVRCKPRGVNFSQKPQCVIDEINDFYRKNNANVHRGLHSLSEINTFK